MNKHFRTAASTTLVVLFSTVALVACGGGGDPEDDVPAPAPAPASPGTGADTAFATPTSTTDSAEAGKYETYAFAENGGQQSVAAPQFASGAITLSSTLSAAQAFAGVALRAYAPSNTGAAPVAAFDASSYKQLKIQLKSSTDGTLQVKLQPSPVSGDGCTATADVAVDSTLTEVVIDLDEASFPLPGHCATGTTIAAVKSGLYAVDVVNQSVGAGAHDLALGTVKLAK